MIEPPQLIGYILNAILHARMNGMDDNQVLSCAMTAIVAAARMTNNIEMMPQIVDSSMKSQDISAALTIH